METPFEDIPDAQRDLRLDRAQAAFDWAAAQGPLGGLILRLRTRADKARDSARIFLGLLLLSVVLGLGFYLGLPFWQTWADSQRETLQGTLDEIEAQNTELDGKREAIRADLATALQVVADPVESGVDGNLLNHIVDGRTILLYGNDGSVTWSTDGGTTFAKVESGVEGHLEDHIADGRTILLYGWGGSVTRSRDGGTSFAKVESGVEGDLRAHIVDGRTILLYGWSGLVTRSSDGGESFAKVESGVEGNLSDHIVDGRTILLYGDGGSVTRSTDGGESFAKVESGVGGDLWEHIVHGRTILLYGSDGAITRSTDGGENFAYVEGWMEGSGFNHIIDGQTILLYGWSGTITRSTDGGENFANVESGVERSPENEESGMAGNLSDHIVDGRTILLYGRGGTFTRSTDAGEHFAKVESGVEDDLRAHIVDGRTILLYGWSGTITRSTDAGEHFAKVESGVEGIFDNHIVDGRTILLYGRGGLVMRSSDGGESFAKVESGVEGNLQAHIVDGRMIVLYGEGSAITRSTDGGTSFAKLESGVEGDLQAHIVDGRTILLYGRDGTIVRMHGDRGVQATALELAAGEAGDTALSSFVDGTLPPRVVASAPVAPVRDRLVEVVTRRAVLAGLAETTAKERDRIDGSPLSLLQREKVQMAFTDYLATCRGRALPFVRPDKDLTEDCLTTWTTYQSGASDNWWQTLADQTPPGILLLFLLVNLGSLYRYNLRLAGFHNSRADLLVAISLGRDAAGLRDFMSENKGDVVNQLALAFAADKVEMGAIKAKLAQAELEIAKAMTPEK